ncbi:MULTISPECIES: IS110 family transposase [unclassified Streptomyces]|uniref:IS110 family transposase n=1 Tax=Streptomyces sp. NBC_00119 TaxID=2975659 RepID=A0AAU1U5L3_9ACTN|nr:MULTISPECIES: IS110 family transposase [unclassified Streptomyces]MCX4641762.1 IS110 family transposase [Streptomyces sp. NBC_01446]MCX4642268.1 IS110 family transposase [Streptomyces sp. NBC_01446]MCX5319257.1 IS110 family transposase [Streptomyces sp. NBC_00120]MCX5320028.1 IS110 family transposase [Streptomyces sp. NBC_00120]MCX5320470.1 IS110 family transposase [Streptomyces sp. NBC_00120]
MTAIWAGIDAGKAHHHCVVIDETGKRLLSRRVANDEPELLQLLADVLALSDEAIWGIDLADGGAALLIDLLLGHGQHTLYIPGMAVNRASEGYRGAGKTDAKDAAIIADQARVRRDLHPLRPGDELVAELKILTVRRRDLIEDRTRVINRLRGHLTSIFPALERALDLTNSGPLVLLTGYQTPAAIRRAGTRRLETWLRNRKVRGADQLAQAAMAAADSQYTSVTGEKPTAQLVDTLAKEVKRLNEQVAGVDKLIEARFREHKHAEVITSMPGIGPLLGAEFVVATGGDMAPFGTPDRLAGFAGVAPAPRDSGKISGNLHRPKRYSRGLQRVFYTSALVSIRCCDESRRFYDRKRAEGKRHTQAVLALARRRVNVLWALLRDGRCYEAIPPVTAAA